MNIIASPAPGDSFAPAQAAVPASPPPGLGARVPDAATQVHDSQELRRALDALARRFDSNRTQLSFRVDEARHQVVISIVDPDSGAVLRQIPAEEVLRMARNLQEWMGGLVDEKA